MNLLLRLRDPDLPTFRLDPRREVTHLLAALMEAMWLAPWFAIILPGARRLAPTGLLALVAANVLAALLIVRLLDSRGVWLRLRHIAFLAGFGLAVVAALGVFFVAPPAAPAFEVISDNVSVIERLSIPPFVPTLILISLLWWRGLRLAVISPTAIRVAFGMRLGILFFFATALFPMGREASLTALAPFFFFGLLGISFARALALREAGSQSASFGPRWSAFMLAAAGGITLLGLLFAALLGSLDPDLFAAVIQPILTGVVFLVTLLMTPLFLVLGTVVQWIVTQLQMAETLEELGPEIGAEAALGEPNQQVSGLEQLYNQFMDFLNQLGGIQMCLTVLVILIVVAMVVLTLRRRQRSAQGDPEELEDLEGDALAGLRDLFRRGREAVSGALHSVSRFGIGRDLLAALTIRRAYAQMARLSARKGFPRAASQTPYEYRGTLARAFPEGVSAVDTLTDAYVRVHYGEVPEDAAALQTVVQALETFKATVSKA